MEMELLQIKTCMSQVVHFAKLLRAPYSVGKT